MKQELTTKFLINSCVLAEDLKTNFKIDFSRFEFKDYHKLRTEKAIIYDFYDSKFGKIIVANADEAICYLHFIENENDADSALKNHFPDCNLKKEKNKFHQIAINIINENNWPEMLKIQVKGTDFQYKVWRGLTKIDLGKITTYSELAKNMGIEGASRAVGSAIGANEIAYIIPCHRVIQKTGKLAGFRWGDELKINLLEEELLKD